MEYLAARVLPQNRIVVIEQNLDANRTFDQWQLLVEQAASQDPQILSQRSLPLGLLRLLFAFNAPDAAPEIQGITAQRGNHQRTQTQQHEHDGRHGTIRPRDTS